MTATARLAHVATVAANRVRVVAHRRAARRVAETTWPEAVRIPSPGLDALPDEELGRLNDLLPWSCFTVDGRGRALGRPAWSGKRTEPQVVPDPRIVALDERIGLAGRHVLEIGCFEGVHTLALAQRAGRVTALDARVENVVKTLVRTSFHGQRVDVLVADAEALDLAAQLPAGVDVCHHVGVLYHLLDPVRHLQRLAPAIGGALWLDTHVARDAEATGAHTVDGTTYAVLDYAEGGRADPFSGMRAKARWLRLDDLTGLLGALGFATVDVLERRDERNGLRVLVAAER